MEKLFYFRAYLRYLVLIDPEKRTILIKEMQKLVGGTENGHFGKMRAVRRFSVRSSYGYQQKDKDAALRACEKIWSVEHDSWPRIVLEESSR